MTRFRTGLEASRGYRFPARGVAPADPRGRPPARRRGCRDRRGRGHRRRPACRGPRDRAVGRHHRPNAAGAPGRGVPGAGVCRSPSATTRRGWLRPGSAVSDRHAMPGGGTTRIANPCSMDPKRHLRTSRRRRRRCSPGRTGVGSAPCAGIAPSSQDDDEPVPVPTLQDRAGDSRSSTSSSGRRADGSPPRPTTCSGLRDSHRPGKLPVPQCTDGRAVGRAPPRTRPAHRLGQRRGVTERMPNKMDTDAHLDPD